MTMNTDIDTWDEDFGDCSNIVVEPAYPEVVNDVIDTWDEDFGDCSNIVVEPAYPLLNVNTNEYKLFAPIPKSGTWKIDRRKMLSISQIDLSKDIHIPNICDTEFLTRSINSNWQQSPRKHLTTQIKSIDKDSPQHIFVTSDEEIAGTINNARISRNLEPYPLVESDFIIVDYLRLCGLEVETAPCLKSELKKLPKCYVTMYGHFLTAEINLTCDGSIKEEIKELQRNKNRDAQIAATKRIRAFSPVKEGNVDFTSLNHLIVINGHEFNLVLRLIDTCAIHGIASYQDFCNAVGWLLKYKDNFTSEEKGRMLDMAIERPTDFDDYALGDLEVYEALECYYEQFQLVYEKLGLLEFYQPPQLTIGGTVKDLFNAALANSLDIHPHVFKDWQKELKIVIDQFIFPSSAGYLRNQTTFTRAILSKCEGGRCRNNKPIDVFVKPEFKTKKQLQKAKLDWKNLSEDTIYYLSLICDIDIAGCYGEGQRNQDYFIGVPEIFDYKSDVRNNQYIELMEWLKGYDVPVENIIKGNFSDWGELLPGCWQARISTKELLKYPQDFFASWFTSSGNGVDIMAKFVKEMASDTELTTTEWVDFDEEYGELKIFNHEIHNGLLQHDGLEWILMICSPRQRNELLKKIQVRASMVYPKSCRIEPDLMKLRETYARWEGVNTTDRIISSKGRRIIRMDFDECHAWFPINLGELIVNNLLIERKKAQIQYGKKSPLDVLFKLCINTLYGDMVSKFFVTSNPVTGNNITARARALAWYMEKGLFGWQSITDGCAFLLMKVLTSGRDYITGESINLHRADSQLKRRKIKTTPLGESQNILCEWVAFKIYDENKPEGKIVYTPMLIVDDEKLEPVITEDKNNPGFQKLEYNPGLSWIDTKAMEHLQKLFPNVSVLHKKNQELKVNKDLSISTKERVGQYSFETKNVYHSASFHGSANYMLVNPEETNVKYRSYEQRREHISVDNANSNDEEIELIETDRYSAKVNPAIDFLNQALMNPENITRQNPAIKSNILKIPDYKNLSEKYDALGLEPGDNILKVVLLQEFSISQFTFQTHEQYTSWSKAIERAKLTDKQSIEGFFLNPDGTLDYPRMVATIDQYISEGILDPFEKLDPHDHKDRADKSSKKGVTGRGKKASNIRRSHPHRDTHQKLKELLAGEEEL